MPKYEKTLCAIRSLTQQGHRPVDLIRAANQEHMLGQIPALERAPAETDRLRPRSILPSSAASRGAEPINIPNPYKRELGRGYLEQLCSLWGVPSPDISSPGDFAAKRGAPSVDDASDIFEKQMQLTEDYVSLLDHVYGLESRRIVDGVPLDGRCTGQKRSRGELSGGMSGGVTYSTW